MFLIGFFLASLVGVTLGFFGGGGSILTVPLFVYVFGLEPKEAIASSLLVVAAASAAAVVSHWRKANVELRTALLFGTAGMAGAAFGGRLAAFLDGSLLLLLFAAMMILTSVAMWRGRGATATTSHERRPWPLLAQGFSVGLLTGLVGAGGGFLIVPALVLWAGLPMPTAVGTSLFVIVLNCLAGFAGYRSHVSVDPGLLVPVGAIAVAGSVLGSRLSHRVDPSSLRRGFAALVLVTAIFVFFEETETWIATARNALPASLPQMIFAVAMLLLGIAAGRATQGPPATRRQDPRYRHGAGI